MNAITNRELESGGPTTADLAAFAQMPPAQQEIKRDLNEPVLDNHNSDVRTEEKQLASDRSLGEQNKTTFELR
jgi:hypothetical protein